MNREWTPWAQNILSDPRTRTHWLSPEQNEKDTDTLVDKEDYRASERTGTAGDRDPLMPINSQVYTRWAVSLSTLEVKNDANFSLAFLPYDLYLKGTKGFVKGSFSSWDHPRSAVDRRHLASLKDLMDGYNNQQWLPTYRRVSQTWWATSWRQTLPVTQALQKEGRRLKSDESSKGDHDYTGNPGPEERGNRHTGM